MSVRSILSMTLVAVGLSASSASAQPHERWDRRPPPYERQHGPMPPGPHADPRHGPDHRHPGAPPPRFDRADRGPGVGPDRRFYRGDRLPPDYRSRHYVINDWRDYRLSPPPRGHRWVQVGADYALVAIATGLIVQVVLNH